MVLAYTNKLPDFNPVAAGAIASTQIPRGFTYQDITLLYSANGSKADEATLKADIERVSLKINGVVRWEMTGKHLVDLNKYYGLTQNNGELVIPLSRPWMKTEQGVDNLAWGTANVNSFQLEVKIASGATTPVLSANAEVLPYSTDLGYIVEVHEFSFASSVAGKYEISTLPKGNGDLVAIHLDNPNITALQGKLNNVEFIAQDSDLRSYHNSIVRLSDGKRVPQAGYAHIDSQKRNRVSDIIPLARLQEFLVAPTLSAAGAVGVVMETLNTPLGLPRIPGR